MITLIANLKGGSGKSTVTFNLALWLMRAGKTVFTYDLDPQCTLSDAAQVRKEESYEPLLNVFTRYILPKNLKPDDEVLIDVGVADMKSMKKAISTADRVVIPVPPSQADIWSTQRFLYIIASEVKDKPPEVFTFVNRADTHAYVKETKEAEQALMTLPDVKVLTQRLSQRTTFRRSFSEGLTVCELEPKSKATQEFEQFANILFPLSKKKTKARNN